MANAYTYLESDYTIDVDALIKPIYDTSNVWKCFREIQDLKSHSLQARYYTQEDDVQYRYNMETEEALSHVGYTTTDVATPVISANMHWTWDELQRINDSKLPMDGRVAVMQQIFIQAQERIAFSGSTVALDDILVASVNTAGTGSTAWGATAYNVTSHALALSTFEAGLGQIIDGIGELKDPLAFVIQPTEYKLLRGLVNANTDLRAIEELNRRMKEINPASPGVVLSKYLNCTVTRDHPGKYTITAGDDEVCLFNINKNHYSIHTSPIEIRESEITKLNGYHIQLLQRFRPVFQNITGIIYEAAVT